MSNVKNILEPLKDLVPGTEINSDGNLLMYKDLIVAESVGDKIRMRLSNEPLPYLEAGEVIDYDKVAKNIKAIWNIGDTV